MAYLLGNLNSISTKITIFHLVIKEKKIRYWGKKCWNISGSASELRDFNYAISNWKLGSGLDSLF